MKRIILVLTAALLLTVMMMAAAPAFGQEAKKEEEKKEEKKEEKAKEEKAKEEKDLPKSGGVPVGATLVGLGTGVLLLGGGLVALRLARQHQ
jgi:H+/gluconate symporter-like permease